MSDEKTIGAVNGIFGQGNTRKALVGQQECLVINLETLRRADLNSMRMDDRVDFALRLVEDSARLGGAAEITSNGLGNEFSQLAAQMPYHMREFVKKGHLDTPGTKEFLGQALLAYMAVK